MINDKSCDSIVLSTTAFACTEDDNVLRNYSGCCNTSTLLEQ